jgi:hypothetical protein
VGYAVTRCFRTSDAALYEQVRLALDAAWGHPTSDGRTVTCIEPAATQLRDTDGRLLLSVRSEWCEYEAVASVLPQLLASGAVEEITPEQYRQAVESQLP